MTTYERGGDHRLYEAYALGYYLGRAVGSDESWWNEAARRGWDPTGHERAAFKDGYDRGVADFVEDEDESGEGY